MEAISKPTHILSIFYADLFLIDFLEALGWNKIQILKIFCRSKFYLTKKSNCQFRLEYPLKSLHIDLLMTDIFHQHVARPQVAQIIFKILSICFREGLNRCAPSSRYKYFGNNYKFCIV